VAWALLEPPDMRHLRWLSIAALLFACACAEDADDDPPDETSRPDPDGKADAYAACVTACGTDGDACASDCGGAELACESACPELRNGCEAECVSTWIGAAQATCLASCPAIADACGATCPRSEVCTTGCDQDLDACVGDCWDAFPSLDVACWTTCHQAAAACLTYCPAVQACEDTCQGDEDACVDACGDA
jgi:hypothetical protein